MPRHSRYNEPFRVDAGAQTRGTRVYIVELAEYLHHRSTELRRFATDMGILYWADAGNSHNKRPYVTEAGAKLLIAHVRAIQGAEYAAGKRFHEDRDYMAAYMKRRQAQKRAEREREKQAFAVKSALTLAIPRAGTEDEAL